MKRLAWLLLSLVLATSALANGPGSSRGLVQSPASSTVNSPDLGYTWAKSDSAGNTVASLSVTRDATPAEGDLIIVMAGSDDNSDSLLSIDDTASDGAWNTQFNGGNSVSDTKLGMWYTYQGSGSYNTTPTVNNASSVDEMWAIIFTFKTGFRPSTATGTKIYNDYTGNSINASLTQWTVGAHWQYIGQYTGYGDTMICAISIDGADFTLGTITSPAAGQVLTITSSGTGGNDAGGAIAIYPDNVYGTYVGTMSLGITEENTSHCILVKWGGR